jgi:hypothetical protein
VNAEAGCRSKQQYLSEADAKHVARLMTVRHRDGFHLYECRNCGSFHVGHNVPAFLRHGVPGVGHVAYGECVCGSLHTGCQAKTGDQ